MSKVDQKYIQDFKIAYCKAIFFTAMEIELKPTAKMSPKAIEIASEDCEDFLKNEEVVDILSRVSVGGYLASNAGHDFWLTRNSHGAGFWDRGLGEDGDKLSNIAETYKACEDYIGDDGLLSLMSLRPKKKLAMR